MPVTNKFDDLSALVSGLNKGDKLAIGQSAVSPIMTDRLKSLSLTPVLTAASHQIQTSPPSIKVVGTTDLFGLETLETTFTFTPKDENTAGPFYLAIETGVHKGTEWGLVKDIILKDMSLTFAPSTEVDIYRATMASDIVLGSANPLNLPISVAVPTYPQLDWVITGSFSSQPISPDAFSSLVGGFNISEYLPSPLDVVAKIGLTDLEIGYSQMQGAVTYLNMRVAYTKPWSVLNIIEVPANGVGLSFHLDFGDSSQDFVELEAAFELAGAPVDIGAHFAPEDFVIWGRLQKGKSASISDIFSHFHVTLPSKFPDIEITTLSMTADLTQKHYAFEIITQVDAGSALKITDLTAKIDVTPDGNNANKKTVHGEFKATLAIAVDTTLFLSAIYDGGGSGLTLAGNATNIHIGKIIAYLASEFGFEENRIPKPIRTLDLQSIETSYNTSTGDFHFKCVGEFVVYETPVDVTFAIDVTHPSSPAVAGLPDHAVTGSKGYHATFGGSVVFASQEFDIRFDTKDTGQMIFVADYVHQDTSGNITLRELVEPVSSVLAADIPADIAINLKVVKFAYMKAVPKTGGKAVNHFLFGVELGSKIGLTDIPLIGDKFPPELAVSFDGLQATYSNLDTTETQATAINALLPSGVGPLPSDGLKEGVLVASTLKLGKNSRDVSLQIPTGGKKQLQSVSTAPAAAHNDLVRQGASSPPAGVSINIQKTFGPVNIQKLGLTYQNNHLFVTGDIALTAEILTIGLLGLGIGSKLSEFNPAVTLSGITITVDEGSLDISGGLYGSIDPLNFNGALQVTVPSMSIGALGGYAQLGSDPSFFMYASINRPLFGYPFFFLDGIAGGLGFNRDLMIPDIDGVSQFPLVSWATGQNPPGANPNGNIGSQVQKVIEALATQIPPKVGEYWVAAGIKFSSFKILNSFALVTVAFGTDFKFAMLGLTRASLPPDAKAGAEPLGFVEMALRVSYSVQEGVLQVEAKLTPASFILSQNCKLTGGFAFYMWFKNNPQGNPSGYQSGDFVVTLGGYNPAFNAPAFYPAVPRLGLNWKVDGNTTIKGGIYFALTPNALMAGGALEAVWQSGNLRAWFTAHADFLLSWKPFHYQISIGMTIGVSYKLDLFFTSTTISVHLGVDVDLWGPSFGGNIHVDLTVISFTVRIGNRTNPAPEPISWADFKKSFLPQDEQAHSRSLPMGATVTSDSYALSSVSKGLIKDLSANKPHPDDPDWIVNAETFELVTMTALPSKTARLITKINVANDLPVGKTDFGVAPVDVAVSDFDSSHVIIFNQIVDGKPVSDFDLNAAASIAPNTSNLPNATWGGALVANPSISQINNTPTKIDDLAVGYTISARVSPPDHTPLPINIAKLQQENEGKVTFVWRTPTVPTNDNFDQSKAMATFQETLTAASGERADLLTALMAPGLALKLDNDVNVTALADSADSTLLSAPVLSYLGEEKQKGSGVAA